MKRIFKMLGKLDYLFIFLSILLILGEILLELTMPEYMRKITILLGQGGEIKHILQNGGIMLLCSLGSLIFSIIVGFFTAKIAGRLGQKYREAIYDKVGSFSKAEISKFSTSSLITRCTNDTTQIQRLVAMGLQILVKAPIMAVGAIIKILGKSWQWSVVTVLAVVIMLMAIITIISICIPRFKKIQKQTDDLNRVTRENLTGVRVIHAFNAEEYQQEKYEVVNETLRKTETFTSRALAFLSPIMSFLVGTLSLAIYWVGAFIINNADLIHKVGLYGDMIEFSNYAMMVVSAFVMMIMIFMMMPRVIVSVNRIEEVLKCEPSIKDGVEALPFEEGTIEFKNVSFKYPESQENAIENISFRVEKGETVAIIGSTGSGKTTLIDLVPRMYDCTEGEVLVDGANVKDYKLKDLHDKIGYISQKAIILSGTVVENVTMGHNMQLEDVLTAIEYSQAKEFVEEMENKENSRIYQSGKNISGGQKQRLSIARALAKHPEIIIFDDSFSALDYKTDKKLRNILDEKLSNSTRLIVAQRIGTIKDADKIIVLDKGKMVGMGTHKQLLKNNEVYREIASTQMSEEELYGNARK